MEENRNNNQVDDIPLEELRAKYLKKKWFKTTRQSSYSTYQAPRSMYTPTYQAPENKAPSNDSTPRSTETSLWKSVAFSQKSDCEPRRRRCGLRLFCDVILLLSVFIVGALTALSFAVSTTEIGGEAFYGDTQNIYDFLWNADDSLINQIKDAAEGFNESDFDEDDIGSVLSSMMKIIRLLFLLIPTAIVAFKTVINVFKAYYHFRNEESAKLGCVAVSNIAKNLMVYVFFAFFGSISGGTGEDEHFVGYTVGKGMTFGMIIGIALVITAAVCTYRINANKSDSTGVELNTFIKVLSCGIGYMCIGAILTRMRIYSILVYVLTSSMSTALLSIKNGFEIQFLIFPMLNLFLFFVCLALSRRVTIGFSGSFKYLLLIGNENRIASKEKQLVDKTYLKSFVPVIILAILSVCAVYVLSNPTFGYGWSVNIYMHFVYIFIISSVVQTVISLFDEKNK